MSFHFKIAAYTIAKNESQFVDRFCASTHDADYTVVLDTGSTDGTPDLLRARGVIVGEQVISPWRFDAARNAALKLVPLDADICIRIDLDEILKHGWRHALESKWHQHTTNAWYRLICSWKSPGIPDQVIHNNCIHARHGFTWRHQCHEALYYLGKNPCSVETDLEIWHFPDNSKSRGQYLALLEADFAENPVPRAHFYLAREYLFWGRLLEAKARFESYLAHPEANWPEERQQACTYLTQIHDGLSKYETAGCEAASNPIDR